MDKYKIQLGDTIRKYRHIKKYSTQQLAKLLGISVGTINHLEHDRNNVFKLDLLLNLIKVLNIPLEEIFSSRIVDITSINGDKNTIQITYECNGLDNTKILIEGTKALMDSYIQCIAEYRYNKQAIELITSFLIHQMDLSKKLKGMA